MSSHEFQRSGLDRPNVCCIKRMYVFSRQLLNQCHTVASVAKYLDMKYRRLNIPYQGELVFVFQTFQVDDNVVRI